MVFSSIPAYPDPANWQQQSNHQTGALQPPPSAAESHAGGSSGSVKPGSMVERARMANIPMPEAALQCPRCESTNTKFCYFNNYNLTQPRHFCKTCRRYWTRGGALRNIPVGGGCRRNRRNKTNSSKSSISGDSQQTTSASASTVSSHSLQANVLGLTPQIQPLQLMVPLTQPNGYDVGDVGLNYGGIPAPEAATSDMNFQMGSNFLGSISGAGFCSMLSTGGIEQWRLRQTQQFPFLGGFDTSPGLYPIQGNVVEPSGYYVGEPSQVQPKLSASMLSQLASVKMEEDNQQSNFSRQFLGIQGTEHWGGSAWTDLSSVSSSPMTNPF